MIVFLIERILQTSRELYFPIQEKTAKNGENGKILPSSLKKQNKIKEISDSCIYIHVCVQR